MTPQQQASPRPLAALARHPWWSAAGVLAAVIVVLALVWDWNWFKGPVERIVQARTQRSFEIGGDLEVRPGRVTRIRADALKLGNPAWSEHPTMASAERLELHIGTLPLLIGRVRVPEIRLAKPRLLLEANPEGGGNWNFATDGDDDGEPLRPHNLWIDDGRLRFVDASQKTDVNLAVSSRQSPRGSSAAPMGIAGEGRWKGTAFELEGHAESPLALQDDDPSYRINLHARAGSTRAHARGKLVDPLRLRGFDLRLELSGQDLEDLYPLLGISLPPTPPYTLDGRFSRSDDTWRYDDFTGKVGDSDLAGSASVTVGGARPYLRADLVSKRLDFDDLAGFVGGTPRLDADGSGPSGPETQPRNAASRVLPDTPYELEKLRAMDARVRLRALRINAPRLPLDDMDARLRLEDGVLQLQPLDFGVADGHVRADIHMDARQDTIRTRVDGAVRGLDLGKLFPDVELTEDAIGKIGGNLAISGTGNSVARILGSADGEIAIGMGRGQISNLLLEYAGLDIAEALRFLLTGDRKVPIRCAFGDFAVEDGIMEARTLAFDTTDTLIVGKGEISLREETLDLELRPRPKDRSILTLRSPLVLEGTFRDPEFHPDLGRLGVRGAVALTLGSIAPPAALLATLELGGGEDHDCGGQYAE